MKRFRCPKCGNDVEANIDLTYDRGDDMLVVQCLRCRYSWKAKPEDNDDGTVG